MFVFINESVHKLDLTNLSRVMIKAFLSIWWLNFSFNKLDIINSTLSGDSEGSASNRFPSFS